MTAVELFAFTASIRDPDARQDAIVALLAEDPTSASQAERCVQRATWRTSQASRSPERQYPPHPQIASATSERADAGPLYAALVRLPERLRTVLAMRYLCGYSVAETAAMLGISDSSVRRRSTVGKKKIIMLNAFRPKTLLVSRGNGLS